MKTVVSAKLKVEGFHFFEAAEGLVEFLKNKHRHTFKIECHYLVSHLDREREIFECREEIKEYLTEAYGSPCQFEGMSCEMIAKEILEFGQDDGMVYCSVFEESTGGAIVTI